MNPAIWSEAFRRASHEPIGLALTVSNPAIAMKLLHQHRPRPGYEDYTICRTDEVNIIFIVKPGVTLDDPEVVNEIFNGGSDNDLA